MNILNKLSIKNLKLNKKRTISTIIGIILSCALICGTATLVTSFQETLVQSEINRKGYYHLQISGVTDEDIEGFKNSRDIKDVLTIYENGYGKYEQGENEYFPYLKITSMSNSMFKYLKFKILEGRFPKNENEIIINKNAIEYGDKNLKVGDKIALDVGQRQSEDGIILGSSNPYQENEKLVNTEKRKFTVVGIIERPDMSFENYYDPGFTAITTNSNFGTNRVFIIFENPKNYKDTISRILGNSDYRKLETDPDVEIKYDDFNINSELLRYEALAFSDSTVKMIYTVVAIVIGIIMITSVFCIKNSISIATTEKLKMYGMLSSVGATKDQIRKNVIFEALILGLIGIPLGIIFGIFGIVVLIYVVNLIGGDVLFAHIDGIVFKTSIYPIILAIILSFITLYLSAIFPARRASKTAPLDLIRSPEKVQLKARKLRVPKIISKIFKTGGELAYKNLKRSKRKYRTTVISITVSISVFIIMNSFIGNVFSLGGNYYEGYEYNIDIYVTNSNENKIFEIKNLGNIDDYMEVYETESSFLNFDMSKVEEYYLDNYMYFDENPEIKYKYTSLYVVGYDTKTFNRYLKKAKINSKNMSNKAILCDIYRDRLQEDKIVKKRIYKYKNGDIIEGKIEEENQKFEIGFVTDIKPYGFEQASVLDGILIVNKDKFKDLKFRLTDILIQSNNPEAFDREYNEKIGSDLYYNNFYMVAKEQKSMILIMKIFLYGFITVITLIGVTNIFNTITSNMELRQREFATLKSIGMTKKEFRRMINLETIFYSVKSLFYGIILGLLGTFGMYKAFSIKLDNGKVYIPYFAILISIVAVFVLIFIIMRYSIKKINKQNIIETIRKENI